MHDEASQKRNLVSIGEASEYLGVSIDTLRRWEKRGRIEPYRSPGGHRHYSKDELDKLFDKKYVRDEPTVRSKTVTENEDLRKPAENLPPALSASEFEKAPAEASSIPHLSRNFPESDLQPDLNLRTQQIPYPFSNAFEAPRNEYSLPPWRSTETNTSYNSTTEIQTKSGQPVPEETPVETKTPIYFETERSEREIRVPDLPPVRVIQREEAMLTSNEAYYQQQRVSILNPETHPPVSPAQAHVSSESPIETRRNNLNIPQINDLGQNKNLLIYISAGVGILILAITWFLLWRSSQSVLSPIP